MGIPIRDKLCVGGALAKKLKNVKIGETVKLTVTAVLKSQSVIARYSVEDSNEHYLEFAVTGVDGGKKPYAEMSAGEMESEMSDVYHNEQTGQVPNREDGGSIWQDVKEQERVNIKPFTRHRPFAVR